MTLNKNKVLLNNVVASDIIIKSLFAAYVGKFFITIMFGGKS